MRAEIFRVNASIAARFYGFVRLGGARQQGRRDHEMPSLKE